MNNKKSGVYKSGALKHMLQAGTIKKAQLDDDSNASIERSDNDVFETSAGIKFRENELHLVDTSQCIPWKFANRSENEMGNLDELMNSIQSQGQLQPVLARPLPNPFNNKKYEIIFGRRRYEACLKLNKLILIILKEMSDAEAVACQNAENQFRKNVSNYSNAVLYSKLISEGIFKSQADLANKLCLSTSSLNDIMAFSKIPNEISQNIKNIHNLPIVMALKIVNLVNESESYYQKLIELAPKIGETIAKPSQLEKLVTQKSQKDSKEIAEKPKIYSTLEGKKIFSYRIDSKGNHNISISRSFSDLINPEDVCIKLKDILEISIK